MKSPWRRLADNVETKMQNSFDRISKVILENDRRTYDKTIAQLNLFKKSEQIKYNRLEARIIDLETCFKSELSHYKHGLEQLEKSAAKDAEKGLE